jgi:diaminopimelate epimerase
MIPAFSFTKMHGLGNDFILVDNLKLAIPEIHYEELAKKMCERHTGIGADGVVFIEPSKKTARSKESVCTMRIINADGSEPEMCGNALRCLGRWIYKKKKLTHETFQIETKAGPKTILLKSPQHTNGSVEVDMGIPLLDRKQIPILGGAANEPVINLPMTIGANTFLMTCVSMGNPHAIIFVEDLTKIDIATIGPKLEHHALFPERINVEFVEVKSPEQAKLIVWERGAGLTQACGTGACAALVAGVLIKKLHRKATFALPGGSLDIEWKENDHVHMTGPAETVFSGTYDPNAH